MIRFDSVTVTYPGRDTAAIANVDLVVDEGAFALVIGETGSGKSTLLRSINGLVPHFSGGHLSGRVVVDGRSTADHRPRDLADVVGFVGQDPDAGFVADIVEDELAYGMENLGVDPAAMRRRVEDVLDMLNLHAVRDRPIGSLSGGQRQRVAIGAALASSPRLLVLDEPTSSLDPVSAEEVLAALSRMVHDQGVTVVVAEHRLERVVHAADLVVEVGDGARRAVAAGCRRNGVAAGSPAEILRASAIAPPVVRLGRLVGWDPLALSVRDARRLAVELRARLVAGQLPGARSPAAGARTRRGRSRLGQSPEAQPRKGQAPEGQSPGEAVAVVRGLSAFYGRTVALSDVDLTFYEGEVTVVMGRNGAGKSTLLNHLVGLREAERGAVRVAGKEPSRLRPSESVRLVGLVPQDAGSLLGASSVAEECVEADSDGALPPGRTREVLDRLAPGLDYGVNPRDLSEGQRLCLSLAVVVAPGPPLVLLDEPTRGLDYAAKARLAAILSDLASSGHCIVVATHDVELAAEIADRVVVLADGDVIADGPARSVLSHSPAMAPQVARVLAPLLLLTVEEVAAALEAMIP